MSSETETDFKHGEASPAPPERSFGQDLRIVGAIEEGLAHAGSQSVLTRHAETALTKADLESGQKHHFPALLGQNRDQDGPNEQRSLVLNTFVWGRLFWETNHMLAASYPENPTAETQEAARQFFLAQPALLPCQDQCAPAWRDAMQKSPPDVRSREALMEWLRLAHNHVSVKTGGSEFSRQDMLARAAQQQAALTTAIYYAGKEDFAVLDKKVTVLERLQLECMRVADDPGCLGLIIAGLFFALLLLVLWLISGRAKAKISPP